jgi:Holliday junction resolvasome RuvABC endonuclease subunit
MTKPIMGIDAGFAGMGVVIVQGREILFAGSNLTKRSAAKRQVRVADDDTDRCQDHAGYLWDVIQRFQPGGAVAEMPSGGAQSARANRAMGMATGIVATVLEIAGLPLEVVTPQAVKMAATRKRDATKEQVQMGVREAFDWGTNLPKTAAEREHACDAAGAVLAAQGGVLIRTLNQTGA